MERGRERSLGGSSKPAARRDGERESDRRGTGVGSRARARPSTRARAAEVSTRRRESDCESEAGRGERAAGEKKIAREERGRSGRKIKPETLRTPNFLIYRSVCLNKRHQARI